MRAIVLHGSPRRGGNSDTLADYFVKGLKSQTDVEVHDFMFAAKNNLLKYSSEWVLQD